MRRRDFITLLRGATVVLPIAVHAQETAVDLRLDDEEIYFHGTFERSYFGVGSDDRPVYEEIRAVDAAVVLSIDDAGCNLVERETEALQYRLGGKYLEGVAVGQFGAVPVLVLLQDFLERYQAPFT
jgi:hypothetical protein